MKLTLLSVFLLLPVMGQEIIGGFKTVGSTGMSYKNPSIGGFVEGRTAIKRFLLIGSVDATNDQKVFLTNGMTVRGQLESGAFVSRDTAITGVLTFGRHSNDSYTKGGTAFGVGARKHLRNNFQIIGSYKFPDTSPNRVRAISFGIEQHIPTNCLGLFWGATYSLNGFEQPGNPKLLYGVVLVARVGVYFLTRNE